MDLTSLRCIITPNPDEFDGICLVVTLIHATVSAGDTVIFSRPNMVGGYIIFDRDGLLVPYNCSSWSLIPTIDPEDDAINDARASLIYAGSLPAIWSVRQIYFYYHQGAFEVTSSMIDPYSFTLYLLSCRT